MSATKHLLTFKEIKKGLDSYKKNVKVKLPGNQTNSVWFSLETIKSYLELIETSAGEKEIPISGIRFYLIASNDKDNPMNIALCPTYHDAESTAPSQEVSFDPKYSGFKKPKTLKSLLEEKGSDNATLKTATEDELSSVLNGGKPCPYYCPDGDE